MFITTVDQRKQRIPHCDVRIFVADGRPPSTDLAQDDKRTDDAGATAWVWYPRDNPGGYYLYANTRNVLAGFGTGSVHVDDLEAAPIEIVVERQGAACPDVHDKAAVSAWILGVAAAAGVHTNSVDGRVKMIDGLMACGAGWQNQVRAQQSKPPNWSDMRARIFLHAYVNGQPITPNGDSDFVVDTGAEGGSIVLEFRY